MVAQKSLEHSGIYKNKKFLDGLPLGVTVSGLVTV